jgi:hypothetical protein
LSQNSDNRAFAGWKRAFAENHSSGSASALYREVKENVADALEKFIPFGGNNSQHHVGFGRNPADVI